MSQEVRMKNQNFTVPNALSAMRIVIVPFFAWAFLSGHVQASAVLLVLSGLTDCFDGMIARKLNQVTELGKMLDPLADKLTQGVVAVCLAVRFPSIGLLLFIFVAKELGMLCCAIVLLKKKKRPCAAKWYGKVATVMFYISVCLIVVMDGLFHLSGTVFEIVSYVLLTLTALMMIYAAVRYFQIFLQILRSDDPKDELNLPDEIRTKTPRKQR